MAARTAVLGKPRTPRPNLSKYPGPRVPVTSCSRRTWSTPCTSGWLRLTLLLATPGPFCAMVEAAWSSPAAGQEGQALAQPHTLPDPDRRRLVTDTQAPAEDAKPPARANSLGPLLPSPVGATSCPHPSSCLGHYAGPQLSAGLVRRARSWGSQPTDCGQLES